jgi:hypothetical protein
MTFGNLHVVETKERLDGRIFPAPDAESRRFCFLTLFSLEPLL